MKNWSTTKKSLILSLILLLIAIPLSMFTYKLIIDDRIVSALDDREVTVNDLNRLKEFAFYDVSAQEKLEEKADHLIIADLFDGWEQEDGRLNPDITRDDYEAIPEKYRDDKYKRYAEDLKDYEAMFNLLNKMQEENVSFETFDRLANDFETIAIDYPDFIHKLKQVADETTIKAPEGAGLANVHSGAGIYLATKPWEIPSSNVRLTFDDGPSDLSYDLIDVLTKHDAPAILFMTGDSVEYMQEISQWLYEQPGIRVGNHSYSHRPYSSLSDQELIADAWRAEEVFESVFGSSERLIRVPYGDDAYRAEVLLGDEFEHLLWDIDSNDWETQDRGMIIQDVLGGIAGLDYIETILFHDRGQYTLDAVDSLLWAFKYLDVKVVP